MYAVRRRATVKNRLPVALRRGVVVIVSASGKEERGFESLHGVWFIGLQALQCCSL
jgi:hypothetical protein